MKVLHYSLGLPPFRSGGLTKYSIDIIQEQLRKGHEVTLLYPGKIGIILKKTKIELETANPHDFNIYELVNPLPVSLIFGISNTKMMKRNIDKKVYVEFLKKIKPDIIHLHTIMGLHPSFMDAARELSIPVAFTSHDYYGIWPNPEDVIELTNLQKLHYIQGDITSVPELSYLKIVITQSRVYRKFKDSFISRKIRKRFKNSSMINEIDDINLSSVDMLEINDTYLEKKSKYIELRNYYIDSIFSKIDLFLFNSEVSKAVYGKYINSNSVKNVVIPVTHGSIPVQKREYKAKVQEGKLKLLFFASKDNYKGLPYFLNVMDNLDEKIKEDISLTTVGYSVDRSYSNMIDYYKYDELGKILDNYDIIICPSMWYETFGFGVIEAMQYGKLSIVSSLVGAKDIINEYKCGFIFKNEKDLEQILSKLVNDLDYYKNKIDQMSKVTETFDTISEHVEKIDFQYERLL